MLQSKLTRTAADNRPLRVGDIVEIKPFAEIVATLDENGLIDGMPFMPEMAKYCGQRATVGKSAHKTCDGHGHLRWLEDTVHLEGLRCDGSAHGGCQARCLMFWKTAWLNRVSDLRSEVPAGVTDGGGADIRTRLGDTTRVSADGSIRYVCQATEVNSATRPLPATDLTQYVRDVSSGNSSLSAVAEVVVKAMFNRYQRWSTRHLPRALRIRDGRRLNHVQGQGSKTPKQTLDLQVGERARIRPLSEIEPTLNCQNMNRGLMFDSEMATWCGASSTVAARVERLVDDKTGELIEISSDCLILDGVTCTGGNRRLCSRNAYDYWREIWLEREND